MCQGTPEEILGEWEVLEPTMDWPSMAARMRARGVGEEMVEDMAQSEGVADALVALCETFRDPLINAMRHERFGSVFGQVLRGDLRDDPRFQGGAAMADATLPVFDAYVCEGASERSEIIEIVAQMLSALEWDLRESIAADSKESAQVGFLMDAILDFFPAKARQEMMTRKERFLLLAQASGADVAFNPEHVDEPRGSHPLAL